MSIDNYLYVRRTAEGKWTVTDESASADFPQEVRQDDARYDTKLEAVEAAEKWDGPVEYGIHIEPPEPSFQH